MDQSLPGPEKVRRCLFCQSPADSREHVIAEWLSKRMGIRGEDFQPARFSEVEGLKAYPPMKAKNFRTRQVCGPCNNGWMSELESWFKLRFGCFVEPQWPQLTEKMVKGLREESVQLIRWLIKSAVIFDRTVPPGQVQIVPESVRVMAKSGSITDDFFVVLGRIVSPGFTPHLVKCFPVWNGGVLHPRQQHAEGFSFAVYLNHLAIRLVRCPDASPGVKASVLTEQGVPVVPFWVSPAWNYDRPVYHAFPNFDIFLDALEIHTGKPG